MRSLLAAALALHVAACSAPREHVTASSTPPRDTGTPALQRFVVAVQLLPRTPAEASRSQLVDALTRLSDALREAAPDDADVTARAERVQALAAELGDRTPSALPPEILATALREGVGAAGALPGERDTSHLARAELALARFDTSRPVLAQVETARAVLGHVANALLVARSLAPAIETGGDGAAVPGDRRRPVEGEAARRASGLVSQLATAPSSDLRSALATVLEAFADVLEPAADPDAQLARVAQALRTDAGRMRRSDGLGPDAAPQAKAGLASAIRGAELLTEPRGCSVCRDWLARARAALDAVHDDTFVAFQRGPLQEACRLVADVLVLAAEPAPGGTAAR